MYIDEVGNSGIACSTNPLHRHLSLTGIIIDLQHVNDILFPELESFKSKFFLNHPDDPVVLHRKDLIRKSGPFAVLKDPSKNILFNKTLLSLLAKWEYRVITVAIDKHEHQRRYTTWLFDPYHYCLRILVERFVLFLNSKHALGDVMAESRGGKEDLRLKESFARIHVEGTEYVPVELVQERLTSRQLKVKNKKNNIAGLQLADMIAHPSFRACVTKKQKEKLPETFGGQIAAILESKKYHRDPKGRIEGWGRKWLP
ncbi:MAG: DUF3800 domain-containing protein [Candidatus Eisenbacteria bacterium]|nr:DUF3800 domain-containing protein [Candidatus Eisenbacteria bacterium]